MHHPVRKARKREEEQAKANEKAKVDRNDLVARAATLDEMDDEA